MKLENLKAKCPMSKLTDKQLEHWRKVLSNMYGSLSEEFTDEDIHAYRDLLQEFANNPEEIPADRLYLFVHNILERKDTS